MARGKFVVHELGTDLRVLEHYRRWLVQRDLHDLNWRMHATKTPTTLNARPLLDAIWRRASGSERGALAQLRRDEMGIRFAREHPSPWVVAPLFLVFQTAAHNDAAPPDPEDQLSVEARSLAAGKDLRCEAV